MSACMQQLLFQAYTVQVTVALHSMSLHSYIADTPKGSPVHMLEC